MPAVDAQNHIRLNFALPVVSRAVRLDARDERGVVGIGREKDGKQNIVPGRAVGENHRGSKKLGKALYLFDGEAVPVGVVIGFRCESLKEMLLRVEHPSSRTLTAITSKSSWVSRPTISVSSLWE